MGPQLAESHAGTNAAWSLVANVMYAFTQWMLLIVLARLSDAHTLGTFSLALAIVAPVFMATNMRLRFVQSADFSGRWRFADFLKVRIGGSSIGLVACLVLSLFFLRSREVVFVLMGVGLYKAVESIQDICIGVCQRHSKMRQAAILTLVSGVLVIATFSVAFWKSRSVVFAAFALALVRVATLVLLDVPTAVKVGGSKKAECPPKKPLDDAPKGWRTLVTVAWPLGVVAALDSLNAGVPRYFLASLHGNSELGNYAAMTHLAFAGFVVVNAFGQSMSPTLADRFGSGDYSGYKAMVSRLFGFALVVGAIGVVGVLLVGDWVIRILYGGGFDVSTRDFALVMAAGAMSYVCLAAVFVLSSAQKLGIQAWLYGTNLVSVALLSVLFVPRFSIAGAALASVAAHFVQLLISMFVISRALSQPGIGRAA